MAAASELQRLRRDIADLAALVRPNARSPLSARDRVALKSEIEALIQRLDELRTQLSG